MHKETMSLSYVAVNLKWITDHGKMDNRKDIYWEIIFKALRPFP
jgi:hypothetical protein